MKKISFLFSVFIFTFSCFSVTSSLAEDEKNGRALHEAASKGDLKKVRRLVLKGIDVNVRGELNRTALHRAAQNGHLKVIEFLLDQGTEMDVRDELGWTALMSSVSPSKEYNLNVVKFLLDRGAKTDVKLENGRTVFHLAAFFGHLEAVEELLGRKPEMIDEKDDWNQTALHLAAQEGHMEVIKFLLKQKKDLIDIENRAGQTALDLAIYSGRGAVIEYLLNSGTRFDKGKLCMSLLVSNAKRLEKIEKTLEWIRKRSYRY